jgi:hypothetical protein
MNVTTFVEDDAFVLIRTTRPTSTPLIIILEEDERVGCDSCVRWRKVPSNFLFHHNQTFFCRMIPSMTCVVPEEECSI